MDDNENYLEYSKMNFSQFTSPFTGAISANQFTTAKFPQNITTANGQVLGLVSGSDGVQFLRQVDGNAAMVAASAFQQQQANVSQAAATATNMAPNQTYITLPITMPGAKPGDAQQTVQIQVLNPNPMPPQPQQAQKFQMGQMQIPIQSFQQGTTVLTVAYSPQDGEILQNHGIPEGMTIVAALQPQDLQLLAQAQGASLLQQHQNTQTNSEHESKNELLDQRSIKSETVWNNLPTLTTAPQTLTADLTEFLTQRSQNFNLQPFLRFNAEPQPIIKREIIDEVSNDNITMDDSQTDSLKDSSDANLSNENMENNAIDDGSTMLTARGKKKRKYKTKPPKPKRQKPGQVHITTALDGTVLFCCPECQMAYPEKECLEQHLVVHKIERRFICDICGAGLKRKEHLERHKLGHNPERPYICSVCMKGFKRKEHLNLHFVIHSGNKTEICGECGKGFYRKDHLRKHIKSHSTKRLREEMNAQANATALANAAAIAAQISAIPTPPPSSTPSSLTITTSTNQLEQQNLQTTQAAICLPQGVTIHVPTSDNQTLPVQIQLPQLMAQQQTSPDGTTSTVLISSDSLQLQSQQQQQQQQQ